MTEVKQKKQETCEYTQYLTQLDLEHHPDFAEAWKSQDQTKFEKVLNDMGVDLSYGYEISVCQCRSRISQKVETGMRISFRERSDQYWLKNGAAVEDIIELTPPGIGRLGMINALNSSRNVEEEQRLKVAIDFDELEEKEKAK
jgi:hypothetical protein